MSAPSNHGIAVRIAHLPHKSLNPNRKGHPLEKLGRERTSRAEHKATLKQSAYVALRNYLLEHPWQPPPGRITVELFVAWDGRFARAQTFPDDDNLIAACKPLYDGLARALGIDDRRFKLAGVEQDLDRDGPGFIVATLTPWEG